MENQIRRRPHHDLWFVRRHLARGASRLRSASLVSLRPASRSPTSNFVSPILPQIHEGTHSPHTLAESRVGQWPPESKTHGGDLDGELRATGARSSICVSGPAHTAGTGSDLCR
jgi:hypothetical protein